MTNPTPQSHADDRMLAETLSEIAEDASLTKIKLLIAEVTTPLRLSNEALRERVKELEKELYERGEPTMPGAWICDKCGFVLQKNNLYVKSGTIGADMRDEVEGCPNDGTVMRGLTWREVNSDYDKMLIEARTKLQAASEVIEKCERENWTLRKVSEEIEFEHLEQIERLVQQRDEAQAELHKWKHPVINATNDNTTPPITVQCIKKWNKL